jgi:SAM-dependent methyltransferase
MERTDWYGDEDAARYDDDTAEMSTPEFLRPLLDVLEELAGDGPVLELAIGTGRVGLPLSLRGHRVAGIDLAPAMVARLRAKPGGSESEIPVVVGDMTTAKAPGAGSFRLVFLVFNSLMNLTTQEAQIACFENAAAHLTPGGLFLVEIQVPALRRLPPGERFVVFDQGATHIGIDEYDTPTQRLWSHHVSFRPDGRVDRASPPFRYAWPAELDLMARIARMQLLHRWGDSDRRAFTAESTKHVSVWRKVGPGSTTKDGVTNRP